jgi:hypothetical protein
MGVTSQILSVLATFMEMLPSNVQEVKPKK